MIVKIKENGWKYTADEKMFIVVNGSQGVVTQIANEYNISKTTFTVEKTGSLAGFATFLNEKTKALSYCGRRRRKI